LLNKFIRPKSLILIFVAVGILIVLFAYNEVRQSKAELLELMINQSHSLLETVLVSSEQVLQTSSKIEEQTRLRLINNGNTVKTLLSAKSINNSVLREIANQNKILRINIVSYNGKLLYSNFSDYSNQNISPEFVKDNLSEIINGQKQQLVLGIRKARIGDGYRYIVAVAGPKKTIIVLNVDAAPILELRRNMGFGVLLRRLANNQGVIYTALQNENAIIAASSNVDSLDDINDSPFLQKAISDSSFEWRMTQFKGRDIFEAVHPFAYNQNIIGLFRIGLSLDAFNKIENSIYKRVLIISIIFILLGSVLLVLVFVYQNLDLVKRQYSSIETFSKKLIQSVNDAIIVLDDKFKIKQINNAGEKLFDKNLSEVENKEFSVLIDNDNTFDFGNDEAKMQQIECRIKNSKKSLLFSRNHFFDENNAKNYVIIIKDLTEVKELEEQVTRREQLLAMGELASGVAHEIRNPLNTIATIIQQLGKDFKPASESDEYYALTKLVHKEVQRINDSIKNFLNFARPEPVTYSAFNISELMNEIKHLYQNHLLQKNISLNIIQNWDGVVNWDKDKIKQVLINLIKNSEDSIATKGNIDIIVSQDKGNISITLSDTGKGISKDNLSKIFNLYFTTKSDGSGIGLSIIQRIITEHNGIISVDSELNIGTTFSMKIPVNI
jgi:PAS domain S-box-containing protein